MKAVGYKESLPVSDADALIDVELPEPKPQGRDLLVRVKAISVNPVDTKIRKRVQPEPGEVKVLGWDASGVVEAVGDECTLFSPGDESGTPGQSIGRVQMPSYTWLMNG